MDHQEQTRESYIKTEFSKILKEVIRHIVEIKHILRAAGLSRFMGYFAPFPSDISPRFVSDRCLLRSFFFSWCTSSLRSKWNCFCSLLGNDPSAKFCEFVLQEPKGTRGFKNKQIKHWCKQPKYFSKNGIIQKLQIFCKNI